MINERSAFAAIDLALLLQHTGQDDQANELLNRSEVFMRKIPRKGIWGSGISDVANFALRGDSVMALTKLREAERAGWRGPFWRYHCDFDPNLASIRDEPEFKAVFADIERDMAQQRARLASPRARRMHRFHRRDAAVARALKGACLSKARRRPGHIPHTCKERAHVIDRPPYGTATTSRTACVVALCPNGDRD
jgi:hypothetical protein